MRCNKCNKEFEERLIHEHHNHPRFMDNQKGLGKKTNLCDKCHNIIHLIIPSIIWKYIPEDKKQICISEVIKFTEHFRSRDGDTN